MRLLLSVPMGPQGPRPPGQGPRTLAARPGPQGPAVRPGPRAPAIRPADQPVDPKLDMVLDMSNFGFDKWGSNLLSDTTGHR